MRKSEFHYELPAELIAQRPLAERSASRLLVLDGQDGGLEHRQFMELPKLLNEGDLLVFNDTRVIPARLRGIKASGGRVEVLIERLNGVTTALVQLKASKSPRSGTRLLFGPHCATVTGRSDDLFALEFSAPVADVLSAHGHMPLPPYIQRDDDGSDKDRYQTVYARKPGAVAAPTAGLHFTDELLAELEHKGVRKSFVTLHVGAGTFQPMRGNDVEAHTLHSEWIEVDEGTCAEITAARARGDRVIAVGTTSLRAIESAARQPGGFAPMRGDTDLFLYPGAEFHQVDGLLTNFHLPESTLLMLVCAFAGYDKVMNAYKHAVQQGYRFFSYGDAMFLTRASARQGL